MFEIFEIVINQENMILVFDLITQSRKLKSHIGQTIERCSEAKGQKFRK